MSSKSGQFDSSSQEYLAGMDAALEELGLRGTRNERLCELQRVIAKYDELEAAGLPSSWPRFPEMLFHPLLTLLAHPDVPQLGSARLETVAAERARPKDDYEQLPCLLDSVERRVRAMRPWIATRRNCLLLGDDDLMSVALERFPLELTVLDIDQDLLNLLCRHNVRCKWRHCDLREGLPAQFKGRFDLVVADPPWAAPGMEVFLQAAAQALAPNGLLFLSTSETMLEAPEAFHYGLSSQGLRRFQSWPALNRYHYPQAMTDHVILALARLGLKPRLASALFAAPYLFSDFMLYVVAAGEVAT